MSEVLYDAFISDPLQHLDIHPQTFSAWLRGVTLQELSNELVVSIPQRYTFPSASTAAHHRHAHHRSRPAGVQLRRKRLSVSSSSSSPSSPSSLPNRAMSSPHNGTPQSSRRPSTERADAAGPLQPRTIISTLAALSLDDEAAGKQPADRQQDTQREAQQRDASDSGSEADDDSEEAAAAQSLSSAAFSRLFLSLSSQLHAQYRTFALLEPYLRSPSLLSSSPPLLQLSPHLLASLTASYYRLDPQFLVHLLGLKLKAVTRSELDIIAQKASVRTVSGQRQFENLRRLYKVRWPEREDIESGAGLEAAEAADGGSGAGSASVTRNASARWKQMRVVAASAVGKMRGGGGADDDEAEAAAAAVGQSTTVFFSHLFCLPLPLARSYTQAVFLCRHRLQTTGKRQASLCSYDDLQAIAHILMEKWCPRVGEEHSQTDAAGRGGGGGGGGEAEQPPRVLRKPSTSALERQLYSSVSIKDDPAGASSASPALLPSPALHASLSAAHQLSLTLSPSASSLSSPASFPVLHLLSSIHPTSSFSSSADDADIGDALDLEFIAELKAVKLHIAEQRRVMDDYVTSCITNIKEVQPVRLQQQQQPSPTHVFRQVTPPLPAQQQQPSAPASSSPSSRSSPAASLALVSASPPFAPSPSFPSPVIRPLLVDKLRPRLLPLLRSLLSVAAGLSKGKKVRLLLVDLVEEVCRPLLKLQLTVAEMGAVMEAAVLGWEALAEVKRAVNVMRERLRAGLVSKGAAGVGDAVRASLYGDEAARCYLNWLRFLSAAVPISVLLYRRMLMQTG